MTNILLTVSYDGTDFCGWQRQTVTQNEPRTVQSELEKALSKMLQTDIHVQGSGRTDSGVHARAQKVTFFSPVDSIPPQNYVRALNGLLPSDIRITDCLLVPPEVNARFSATSRTYRYFMQVDSVPLASDMRFVWPLSFTPELEVLNQMASYLHGEIDCATFAAAGDQSQSTFRYIDHACFWFEADEKTGGRRLVFEICANAFLWKMVRSITGTLIQLAQKGQDAQTFKQILESHDRSKAGVTAPPTGLFLWDVSFEGKRVHP
ncbi:MAG TPA: tRNA pseudouridine(38-40) synthase TruA [Treponema sp.]|jgi:tRNA pseudouridine38-40 synthase|nr:tRNA pseudouridine(38-40) synthase TruA [Treponema sp.]